MSNILVRSESRSARSTGPARSTGNVKWRATRLRKSRKYLKCNERRWANNAKEKIDENEI